MKEILSQVINTIVGFIKAHTVVSVVTATAVVTVGAAIPIVVSMVNGPETPSPSSVGTLSNNTDSNIEDNTNSSLNNINSNIDETTNSETDNPTLTGKTESTDKSAENPSSDSSSVASSVVAKSQNSSNPKTENVTVDGWFFTIQVPKEIYDISYIDYNTVSEFMLYPIDVDGAGLDFIIDQEHVPEYFGEEYHTELIGEYNGLYAHLVYPTEEYIKEFELNEQETKVWNKLMQYRDTIKKSFKWNTNYSQTREVIIDTSKAIFTIPKELSGKYHYWLSDNKDEVEVDIMARDKDGGYYYHVFTVRLTKNEIEFENWVKVSEKNGIYVYVNEFYNDDTFRLPDNTTDTIERENYEAIIQQQDAIISAITIK